ncbi:hypothetical protein STCU_11278 [Strigomonas culicis]|uniref:Uncharacterized protein n=1 Tax=Strigomonas culicis TaxID=28005 RepID=S9TJ68_9TRYP|nr:hypothetical protein STCU_11278 [Strigomonas culicis]|eukprot:EPY16428.1 hypothetical protein STCU_11278 [Strigomonas culicis]
MAYQAGFKTERISDAVRALPENRFNVWCQSRPENFFDRRLRSLMTSVKREWEKPSYDGGEPERVRTRKEVM